MSEPTEIVTKKDGELFVFAKDPAQMTVAQQGMIDWAEHKIVAKTAERDELQTNLDIAMKNKWRTSGLKNATVRAQKKVEFYEKIRDALKAGYYIIPDMDIDVFAIRTTAKHPRQNRASANAQWGGPSLKDQKSNMPPSGEGRYVSPDRGHFDENLHEKPNKDGTTTEMRTRWWEEFTEHIDFPFAMAKPDVLVAAQEALQKKIFDEIGVLPRARGADPMVVGRITYQINSYQRKSINFLVAWFLDTKEI